MKKIILAVIILLVAMLLVNIEVSTKQGINYKWQVIKIPLYLKVIDFFDRNYNYKFLVKKITGNSKKEEDRIMLIFKWTYENIRKTPEGFPIIDDHVWYTIVRGYGAADQISDVFTTLLNYGGFNAYYLLAYKEDKNARIPLSFVKFKDKWIIFDPCNGAYFKNKSGNFSGLDDIKKGDFKVEYISKERSNVEYSSFLADISDLDSESLKRANIQSPVNRFKFELEKLFRRTPGLK